MHFAVLLNIEFALLVSRKRRTTTRVWDNVVSLAFATRVPHAVALLAMQPSLSVSGHQELEEASIESA